MAKVMFAISFTISKIFPVETFPTLILAIAIGQCHLKYANPKSMRDLPFYGNSNVLHICRRFQDIHCRNGHNLDLNL